MIKVIKNGKEKVFQARCTKCATDFSYTAEDIEESELPESSRSALTPDTVRVYPSVVCPVCGGWVYATKYTAEDLERIPPLFTGMIGGA